MKTIPVSLIVAGMLSPALSLAQPQDAPQGEPPRREGGGDEHRGGPQRPFGDFWKKVDKDQDNFLSLEEFSAMPRIENLPEDKRVELFKRLDKDADGKLAREELARIGRGREGQGPPMQRLWELDTDKSGGISLDEFKAGQPFKKLPPERLEQLFQRLDTDHDGVITPKDKPEPFKREGGDKWPKHPDGGPHMDPRQIIRQLDKDGDGALSFEEFRVGPMVKDLGEDAQEDHFEALDKNHDQKLTADDFPPPPPPHGDPGPPEGPPPAAP